MDELLTGLAWLVVELLLIGTGRLVVRTASMGRWRGEAFGGDESRIHAAAGSLSFMLQGQRVITRVGLLFAGLGFYMLAPIIAVCILRT